MHPEDYILLGKPEKVKVTSANGKYSVLVRAQPNEDVLRRNVFIPRSVWANVIVDAYSVSTGSPIYKGGIVYVEPSEGEILEAEYIIDNIYR